MPYIKQERRAELRDLVDLLDREIACNANFSIGDMNYIITNMVLSYLLSRKESYSVHNELIGVLECAKLEMYRKLTSSYEEIKIRENGDI